MLDSYTMLEQWQLKILYIAIYGGLGLINGAKVSKLNHAWALRARSLVREEYESNQHAMGEADKISFNKRFPIALSEVVHAFNKGLGKTTKAEALIKWRWLCRNNSDRFILRYIHQYGDSIKAAKKIAEGIVFHLTKCNAEQEMKRGEIFYMEANRDLPYVEQFKKCATLIVGHDLRGAPLVVSLPKFHNPKAQSKYASKRLVTNILENAMIGLPDNVDGCIFIWDLTDWGQPNWDHSMIWFMLQSVYKAYPRLASRVILYRAPKVFEVMFKLISPLVEPIVTVQFARNTDDMLRHIAADQLPQHLGGKSTYDASKWTDPRPAEDMLLHNEGKRTVLLNERQELLQKFEQITIEWFTDDTVIALRAEIMRQIYDNYWVLDPFVRSRFLWDRHGTLGLCRKELAPGGIAQPLCQVKRPKSSDCDDIAVLYDRAFHPVMDNVDLSEQTSIAGSQYSQTLTPLTTPSKPMFSESACSATNNNMFSPLPLLAAPAPPHARGMLL